MFLEALFERGDVAVLQSRRFVVVALRLGTFGARLEFLQLRAHLADFLKVGLFAFPLRCHRVGFLLESLEFRLQFLEPLLGGLVLFLLERDLLDFETPDVTRDLVEFLRAGIHLGADPRARLV